MTYKDFTQMSVWKKAFALVIKYYELAKSFPEEEKYGMISDVRKALNSVTHNIAEGLADLKTGIKPGFIKYHAEVLMN